MVRYVPSLLVMWEDNRDLGRFEIWMARVAPSGEALWEGTGRAGGDDLTGMQWPQDR